MRKTSNKIQILLCSLVAFLLIGCHKEPDPVPEARKYVGLWNFTTQMSVVEYDCSVSPADTIILVEDSIIKFRGSVSSVDGKNRMLIEFIQNTLVECRFDENFASLWEVDSGHDSYSAEAGSLLGWFQDYKHLYLHFSKTETQGDTHTRCLYKISGVKKE